MKKIITVSLALLLVVFLPIYISIQYGLSIGIFSYVVIGCAIYGLEKVL